MEKASTPTTYLSGKLLKRPYVSNQREANHIIVSHYPNKLLSQRNLHNMQVLNQPYAPNSR
jgi:hypothetical protein